MLMSSQAPTRPEASLVYVRGAGALDCPDEVTFRENVAAKLGFDPFVAVAKRRVVVQLDRASGGYAAQLQLLQDGAAARSRSLTSSRCEELQESLLLAVALAIDPQLLTRPAPAEPPPAAPVAEPPPVQPAPVAHASGSPPAAPESPPSPWQVRFGAGVHGTLGLAPGVRPGFFAGVGFRKGLFELLAEGRFDLASPITVLTGQVLVRPILGGLLPCVAFQFGLGVCAQVSGGMLTVEGQLPGGRSDGGPLVLAGGRVRYEVRSPWPVSLAIRVSVLGVVTPVTVVALGKPVWAAWPVTIDVGLAFTGWQ